MFKRQLPLPEHSFFLFGPRGTGKTTWLKQVLPVTKYYNLLQAKTVIVLADDHLMEQLLENY
ncbi:MAG: hypothetical protein R3A13_05595 [Bdellovibrionota bacterium]